MLQGLSSWLSGKDSASQWRRCRRQRFDPWVGKIPCRRGWQPAPAFLLLIITSFYLRVLQGLSSWLSGKHSASQWRRRRRQRFDPWVGKIPWRRGWQPTPAFLPGKSQGQRSLVGYSPCGGKELDTTQQLNHHHLSSLTLLRTGKHFL